MIIAREVDEMFIVSELEYDGVLYSVTFVVEDDMGDLVENALVSIGSIEKLTDENGSVVFYDFPSGSYDYEVTKDGYEDFEGNVSILNEDVSEIVVLTPY